MMGKEYQARAMTMAEIKASIPSRPVSVMENLINTACIINFAGLTLLRRVIGHRPCDWYKRRLRIRLDQARRSPLRACSRSCQRGERE